MTVLLPELARRGHQITMYCRSGEEKRSTHEGVNLTRLPSLESKRTSTLSHGLVASAVARVARHDVVLVVNVANTPYCVLARATGQRVVLNTDGQEWLRGKWGSVGRRYFLWCARHAAAGAAALVSDCREMSRVYQEDFGALSSVIPYSAMPSVDAGHDLTQFGVRAGAYGLVAARMNPENNVDRIAAAFARSRLDVPLLVAGTANYDSPVAEHVRQIARSDKRIRPIGHVGDRGTFASLLKHARVYIHGHSVGGMNPSLVEAMAAGALVVALGTPFNREVLGNTGVYFDSDDELISVLNSLSSGEGPGEALRDAASSRAFGRFCLRDVADAYELLLTEVANLPSARHRASIATKWDRAEDTGPPLATPVPVNVGAK